MPDLSENGWKREALESVIRIAQRELEEHERLAQEKRETIQAAEREIATLPVKESHGKGQ